MASIFLVTGDHEFETAARGELVGHDRKLTQGETLVPGVFLIRSTLAAEDFAALLAHDPPIYARHMFPVQATMFLTKSADDLERMARAVSGLPRLSEIKPETPFAIQARLLGAHEGQRPNYSYRSFAIKECLAAVIQRKSGAIENIRKPEEILSVVCMGETAYLGLSPADLNLSSWAGGMRRLAKRPELISRAELKLQEALEVFGVELPAGGEALDLGASPGGWTRLLLEAGLHVTAVDPAELDPRLDRYSSRLTHHRGDAEQFLKQALREKRRYATIVSDMRMNAIRAARLLASYAPLLDVAGCVITTLKLPHETSTVKPARLGSQALELLHSAYPYLRARQLFHNRQEITVFVSNRTKNC
jgi:23S rRNA (cytidine2498-2'-O)-methyltransferase